MGDSKNHTCCFLGHRKIIQTAELVEKLKRTVEMLILERGVSTFLFGSRSEFDKICLDVVTELKEKDPHIKRVYVRAEYPEIDDSYLQFLLRQYEDTYFPERLKNAGASVYVERNREMIDKSSVCVVFFDKNTFREKSGTKLAYEYAMKKKKEIFNMAK